MLHWQNLGGGGWGCTLPPTYRKTCHVTKIRPFYWLDTSSSGGKGGKVEVGLGMEQHTNLLAITLFHLLVRSWAILCGRYNISLTITASRGGLS